MSRTTKARLATAAAVVGAVVAVAGWVIPRPAQAIDQHWVRSDTFQLYRVLQSGQRQQDSIISQNKLDRIDTTVQALYRDCKRRHGCP